MAYGYIKNPEDKNQLNVDREVSFVVVGIFECKVERMGNASITRMLSEEVILFPKRHNVKKD